MIEPHLHASMTDSEAYLEQSGPAAEESIRWLVQWLKLGIETVGATLIAIGVIVALVQLVRVFLGQSVGGFTGTRLTLARYLALALEFQLGADILSTAIAPSWDQIGKLGAIAVIRTGLNYFLSVEMKNERHTREAEERVTENASIDGEPTGRSERNVPQEPRNRPSK